MVAQSVSHHSEIRGWFKCSFCSWCSPPISLLPFGSLELQVEIVWEKNTIRLAGVVWKKNTECRTECLLFIQMIVPLGFRCDNIEFLKPSRLSPMILTSSFSFHMVSGSSSGYTIIIHSSMHALLWTFWFREKYSPKNHSQQKRKKKKQSVELLLAS